MYKAAFCIFGLFFLKDSEALPTREIKTFNIGGELVNVSRIQPVANSYDQCYVDVVVHNSSSFRYGVSDAVVTVLSRKSENNDYTYTGFSESVTNNNGQACVLVHCRDEGLIFVEKNSVRIFALNVSMQESRLPPGFYAGLMFNNEFVRFYSYPWGTVLGRTGPVYTSVEQQQCFASNLANYHFVFSYISIPDRLEATVAPTVSSNLHLQDVWHYGPEDYRQYCFIKVKVKTLSSQIELAASSHRDTASGDLLGIFFTGPQYNLNLQDTSNRASCIQFRCPVYYFIDPVEMNTYLDGNITVPGQPNGCCVRDIKAGFLQISPTRFHGLLVVDQNYGPDDGIYIANSLADARARCFTGQNFLGTEYVMDANKGYAFEYDCFRNENCEINGPIVG